MRGLGRWIRRAIAAVAVLVLCLLLPSAYIEVACRGDAVPQEASLLPPRYKRPEVRTLLTYPERHIVHAYDDYARVIATGDPHDYNYLVAIRGFWTTFCALSEQADALDPEDRDSRLTVHVIGVSFTAELIMKAAYEETLGRIATWVRGDTRAPLDNLSAEQAAAYAAFLQQTPWYEWDFTSDAAALRAAATQAPRDRERAIALGLEYAAKARYADVIAGAVEGIGGDARSLRLIATGLTPDEAAALSGVAVIEVLPEGIVLETPRYRALTILLADMAEAGAEFVEIAGNDDILFTALGPPSATGPGTIAAVPRQGAEDLRTLHVVRVPDLAAHLRQLGENGLTLEHIHDY